MTTTYLYDRCRWDLDTPRFFDMPLANLRKLWNWALKDDRNVDAIEDTATRLEAYVQEKKEAWAAASRSYQNEWRDPSTRYGYKSKDEIKKIKAHNTKLTNAVKSAKSAYEHAVKAQQLLSELRQKYNY